MRGPDRGEVCGGDEIFKGLDFVEQGLLALISGTFRKRGGGVGVGIADSDDLENHSGHTEVSAGSGTQSATTTTSA
jgi:hypothetical protein